MNILDILEDKKAKIINNSPVTFTAEELNVISDPTQLRTLKIYVPMPDTFEKAKNVEDCVQQISNGDCIYRVLEYCVLTNRALQSVTAYVKRLC